jgi:ParB/RepB/Spo0J family partition protein
MEATTTQRVTKRKGKGPTPVAKDVEVAPVRPIVTTRVTAHVREIRPGTQQYRKHFDERALADLAESIRRTGIQSPPWVRRAADGVGYELIAGERRWRAARAAGLEEIAVDVKSYDGDERIDDEVALELSVLENNQRADPHPLEECDAFVALRDTYGHTAEQIAAKIKRSPGYVYERLALEGLGEVGRKAMWDGKIGIAVAHAFSRIKHASTQAEAVKDLTRHLQEGESVQVAWAKREIVNRWMLRIADAPFSTSDETLVAKAGACTSCPKRSSNQGVLFEQGLGKEDLCTDRVCWGEKRAASDKRVIAEAKAQGRDVLSKEESKALFPYGSLQSSTWVSLDGRDYALTGDKRWRDVLGAQRLAEIDVVYAHGPEGLVEIAKRSQVLAIVKKVPAKTDTAGIKELRKPRDTPAKKAPGEQRDGHSQHVIDERAKELAIARLVGEVERGEHEPTRGTEISKCVITAFLADRVAYETDPGEWRRLGFSLESDVSMSQASVFEKLAEEVGEMPIAKLRGLLVAIAAQVPPLSGFDAAKRLLAIAEIDPADFREQAAAQLEADRAVRRVAKKASKNAASGVVEGDDE